jgi:hypothetical protein
VEEMGFRGSNSSYIECVGCRSDAGQKGFSRVDVKVTVSPSLITSFEGVNPSLVSVIVRVDERRGAKGATRIKASITIIAVMGPKSRIFVRSINRLYLSY